MKLGARRSSAPLRAGPETDAHMLTRRGALAGFAGMVGATSVRAFPHRTVTIIVPYPAGGPVDVVARLIAQGAAGELKQSIMVDNRAGGAGVIGSVRGRARRARRPHPRARHQPDPCDQSKPAEELSL